MLLLGALLGHFLPLLGRSWGALGRSGALVGHSWGTLVASWGALGPLLAALGALLGRSWDAFGCSWGLKRIWAHLGPSWKHLGQNIEKTSSATHFLKQFWHPKWRPKALKIAYKKQRILHNVISTFFAVFSHFAIPADGDMCRANPYKTLAGRTKIEVRLGQAG